MEQVKSAFVCKTWKTKTLAAALAVVAAVALPQFFHALGMVTDLGSRLGETFLPMHIAIFLVAFFAGPWAGLAAGLVSPALSYGLTTLMGAPMPTIAMLPYMTVELAVYGLTAGLLKKAKLPTLAALVLSQLAGRGVRAVALVVGVYLFSSPVNIAVIWTSVVAGLPGLILQWIVAPLLVFYVERRSHD